MVLYAGIPKKSNVLSIKWSSAMRCSPRIRHIPPLDQSTDSLGPQFPKWAQPNATRTAPGKAPAPPQWVELAVRVHCYMFGCDTFLWGFNLLWRSMKVICWDHFLQVSVDIASSTVRIHPQHVECHLLLKHSADSQKHWIRIPKNGTPRDSQASSIPLLQVSPSSVSLHVRCKFNKSSGAKFCSSPFSTSWWWRKRTPEKHLLLDVTMYPSHVWDLFGH
jgi:hypothetical protein